MAIAVPNQWPGGGSEYDVEIKTLPTSGSWIAAVVAWRSTDGTVPQITVGDLPRNLWTLAGTSDHVAAGTHAQVWLCPKALFDGFSTLNVYIAAMAISASDIGTVNVSVFEITGMSDAMTIESVTVGFASAATVFSIVMPAPAGSANCLMIGAAAIDDTTKTVSVTSVGWTALTQISSAGPDVKLAPAWRTSTATQTPAWSSSGAANWVGIAVAVRETGTAVVSSNPNYPTMAFQLGLGYGLETPLQAVPWTQPVGRHLETNHQRGVQVDLGLAQAEATALRFRNDDGAFASRDSISAGLSAAGTTTTAKILDADAAGLFKGDWFQLYTSAGTLKATTVHQITTTPTSAAGTTTITFSPAASTSTASGDILTTTPVDVYTPYRLLATWAGKTYPVCGGWLESCVQSFEVESFGQVSASGVDALKLQDTTSLSALRGEILRRNPTHYWPLDDAAGSTAAQNEGGYSQAQLVETLSKYAPRSGGSADFGASTAVNVPLRPNQSIVGDPGSGWAQSGLVAADLGSKGRALVGQDTMPSLTNGITITGLLYVAAADLTVIGAASVDPTIVILRNLDPGSGVAQGSIIKLHIEHTAGASQYASKVTVWDQATHAATQTNVSNLDIANDSWVSWALVVDRTSWTVYIAGAAQPSGVANLVADWSGIDIGGEADAFSHSRFFNAIHAHIAIFPRKLSQKEINAIRTAAYAGGLVAETSERRIQRKLDVAGWKGARVLSTSGLVLASEGTETASVAAKNAEIASYEDGQVFADALAQTQFRSRAQLYQQSSRATLGELTGSGEIPYTRDIQIKLDPAFIFNLVRIANVYNPQFAPGVGSTTAAQTNTSVAADTTSAAKYRPNPFDRTTRLSSQADAFALACWLLSRYAKPQRRITQLTINPAAYTAAWPFCLGVEIGDLVTVNRRPVGAPATSQLYRVLRIQQTQGQGLWQTVLTLALAPAPSLVVGDATKGILGANSMAA